MTALDTWMQLSLACAGVAVCLAQAWPQPATAQQPADSPYERWLTQDVAYIIEDGERAVFTTLASDDERQRFIEQFWERRDPTPGTPENEAREQHYHRIAYANSRYTSSFEGSLPGWRTDRGRFYIVHGPPDENESHPSGGRSRDGSTVSADPWELWIYRPANGQPEIRALFIQAGGAGGYRLVEP